MTFKQISVADCALIIEKETCNIIDIRDPGAFTAGHMPNAMMMNNERVEAYIKSTDKSQPLFVCCYHGNSSKQAATFFSEQGFEDVYSLDGGFEAWKITQAVEV